MGRPSRRPAWAALIGLVAALGCEGACPADESIVIAGEDYCGSPCATCAECGEGFSCQLRGARGVCVDDAFLVERSLSTACTDPCPDGEARYQGSCARICNVDGECDHCCVEPSDIEFRICAPDPGMCG